MKWSVKATWLARSPTKSKTASRGAEMTVSTVTGPKGRRLYGCRPRLRRAARDRQMALARVDALSLRAVALGRRHLRQAEGAHGTVAGETMDELARNRSAPARAAVRGLLSHGPDALPQYASRELRHAR